MGFPLFADISKKMSLDYGVLVEDPKDDLFGAALRGLFIIDDKGVIRHKQTTDAPVGRNVNEAIRLVEAFQFTDKHGKVCPANWTDGGSVIDPDPIKKMEYFKGQWQGDE